MTGPGDAANAVENAQREQIRTGAEVQAFNKRVLAEVARYLPDIELRKWSIRRALEKPYVDNMDVLKVAEAFYAFVTAPIGEKTE